MSNIMIVDDEEDVVQMMSETLQRWGFNPIPALNGNDALDKFQLSDVDVVITDLMLPKMDGVKLLGKIKEIDKSTEVILFTGYPEVGTAINAMKGGAYDYLVKPVDLSEMKVKIERALEKKQLAKTLATLKGLNWAMIISIPLWLVLGIVFAYLIR